MFLRCSARIVDDYYKGMAVTVMLQNSMLKGNPTAKDIHEALAAHYDGKKVNKVHPFGYEDPMICRRNHGRKGQHGTGRQWT